MIGKTILVVDDDAAVRRVLVTLFESDGYAVAEAADARATLAVLDSRPVALITLDVGLGGDDGFVLAREIRTRFDVPIIMISGKADEIDRVVGLELGADDYITKPFNLREVLARVRAVIRRYEPRPVVPAATAEVRMAFDGWVLDVGARRLESEAGEVSDLTTAEFNLLVLFAERARRVLSRETILDNLRGIEWSPYDRSVDTLIGRLRKKVENEPGSPSLIKTVRGVGYVFTADVKRL